MAAKALPWGLDPFRLAGARMSMVAPSAISPGLDHLVVGYVKVAGATSAKSRLIFTLIKSLGVEGAHVIDVQGEGGGWAVHCAFEREADAARMALAVHARSVARYPHWKSQRAFLFDERAEKRIATTLSALLSTTASSELPTVAP